MRERCMKLTLNQLVEGSNPSRPTNIYKDLARYGLSPFLFFATNMQQNGRIAACKKAQGTTAFRFFYTLN